MTRTIPDDWYPGTIPDNSVVDETAHVESSYIFQLYRSTERIGLTIGRGSSLYLGAMFDVGPAGRVNVGEFVLINGARIICDAHISIEDYAVISWNVVLMDTYRVPLESGRRREALRRAAGRTPRRLEADAPGRPVRIGRNTWIGFDSCVLPGVTIGEGSIVGARSVVVEDVAPYTVVVGNPARVIRHLDPGAPSPHAPDPGHGLAKDQA